jgi:DNA-directed RNA polymerase II subunit RPB1
MSHPTVVFKTIKSNNPWEIFKIFGIESLRNMLIDNFNQVISNGSSNLSRTHLELLIDSMTRRGIITPVSRDGVLKDEAGPLTRASFEQSSDNMLIAAKRGEVESVSSVSASIILGQSSKLGSGIINLKLDIDMILKNKKLPQIQDSEFEEYVELF